MVSTEKPWWRRLAGRPPFLEGRTGTRVSLALVIVSSGVVLATAPPGWLAAVTLAMLVVASIALVRQP